jgi:hypothetical protein
VRTLSFNRTAPFKTAEEPKARVTTAENKAISREIARNRAENVPKAAVDKAEEGTTAVAAADRVAEAISVVAVAEPIREPADALLAASPLAPNADRLPEMALLGPSAGVASLQETVRTACDTMARLGSGATTASCGPLAMERPHTEAPRKGMVAKTRKRMPILDLWPLQKRSRFFGSKRMPTWPLCIFRPR